MAMEVYDIPRVFGVFVKCGEMRGEMKDSDREALLVNSVPAKFAKSLLSLVVQRGYDVDNILDLSGIDFNPLDPQAANYQEEISALKYSKLYQQVLSVLQDESFGLQPGKGVTPGAFRMLCYCIIHCETLGKAIRRACEFLQIFHEVPYHIDLQVTDSQASVSYSSSLVLAADNPIEAGDAYGLSAWHRFFAWMIGQTISLEEVHFSGNSPNKLLKYQRLFNSKIFFEKPKNSLVFDSGYLNYPVIQTEASLKELLRTAPYQLMVMPGEKR